MQKRTHDSKEKLFEELVIDVKSVVKVNKGGRQRRFHYPNISSTVFPRSAATCSGVLIDFKAFIAALAIFNFVLAPSDLETTSRIPANSKIARTDPPAITRRTITII